MSDKVCAQAWIRCDDHLIRKFTVDGGIGEIEEIDWMRKCWASRSTLFCKFFWRLG